jgi:hypothetical protein
MYPPYRNRLLETVTKVIAILVVIACVYSIATTFLTAKNTGKLTVTSSEEQSDLSISQEGRNAVFIGKGSSTVRLKPGTYRIAGSFDNKQASTMVTIGKDEEVSKHLQLKPLKHTPAIDDIDFANINELTDSGLTSAQAAAAEQFLFSYKPTAHKIEVVRGSVQPGPHNPKSADPNFSLNFNLKIDDTAYKASATYPDLTNIGFILYDANNNPVFDSAAANSNQAE